MKVILLSELKGKGGEGDVVDVAQGYAENYLFPNRIALRATAGNLKQLEERRHKIAEREAARIKDAEELRAVLDGKVVEIDVKVGEEGQLFGSVTNAMIAEALNAQYGVEIDRKRIELARPIKTAGLFEVVVSLYRTIMATIMVQVGKPAELEAGATTVPASEELAPEDTETSDETEQTAVQETEEAVAEGTAKTGESHAAPQEVSASETEE